MSMLSIGYFHEHGKGENLTHLASNQIIQYVHV